MRRGVIPANVFLLLRRLLRLLRLVRLLGLLDLGLLGLLDLRLLGLLDLRLLGLPYRGGFRCRDDVGLDNGLLDRLGLWLWLLLAILPYELPEMIDTPAQRPPDSRVDATGKLLHSPVERLQGLPSVVALARADALVDPFEASRNGRRGLRGDLLTATAARDQEGDEKHDYEQRE